MVANSSQRESLVKENSDAEDPDRLRRLILFACASVVAQGQVTARQLGTRRKTPGADPGAGSCTVPATNGADSKGPDSADPEEQKIWNAARQLDLDPEQRAQLSSSLKERKDETATLKKALQDARAALAHTLQNGQTSLESEIEDLASASAKVQELQLRRWAALYAVLTPDQQRRLLMMRTPLSQAATFWNRADPSAVIGGFGCSSRACATGPFG
jgi:Spy/CpxP family protein refolding chaperone